MSALHQGNKAKAEVTLVPRVLSYPPYVTWERGWAEVWTGLKASTGNSTLNQNEAKLLSVKMSPRSFQKWKSLERNQKPD